MLEKIFGLDNFNIIEDDQYYYFIRALNNADHSDIINGIVTSNGEITRIRTDRERFDGTPRYTENSSLSLEEIFNHIKMHHSYDTNCISLSTNANVSCLYGRGYYHNEYILVKVPKEELGKETVNAGLYMMQEINKRIKELIDNNKLDSNTIELLKQIESVKTDRELDYLLYKLKDLNEEEMFEKGITFADTKSVHYPSLNTKQNLEKNKIIAKLDILGQNLIPIVNNKFLIRTLGNAFSSLELIHYQDIKNEEIITVDSNIIDAFSILQQLPNSELVEELKRGLLTFAKTKQTALKEYKYNNITIDREEEYTIEKMYDLTGGNLDFYTAINMYKKSFYLAKSKLRTLEVINNLKSITNNNSKYQDLYSYMMKNTFGVEPEIFSRVYTNKFRVSESVSLNLNSNENELFEFVNNLLESDLEFIINNPTEALKYYINNFKSLEYSLLDKEEYYANAIIDLFDWDKLNIVSISNRQREHIVNSLKEHNVVDVYEELKSKGVKEKDIANVLLTTVIKDKTLDSIDLKDTFTLEELEDFVGYYKINQTKGLKLRSYQAAALKNINKGFKNHQFTSAVLPTGGGKSFVALAYMLQHNDEEMLYLAPNDLILEQLKDYIVNIICEEEFVTKDELLLHGINPNNKCAQTEYVIKKKFPHLKLATYQKVLRDRDLLVNEPDKTQILNKKYGLIVFDELHRSGAKEWETAIKDLLNYQDKNTKVLGITATPTRDMDNKDMANEWAEFFGYTKEEILSHKHLAINMDLEEAIRLGYVMNPKIVECEYTLIKDGSLERLKQTIESIEDEELRREKLAQFEILRRKLEQADGIEKVIGDNIKNGGKYIVFCPVVNKVGNVLETEDGEREDFRLSSEEVIIKYKKEMIINMMRYYGYSDELINSLEKNDDMSLYDKYADELNLEFEFLLGAYSDAKNQHELNKFKKDNGKTKFVIVLNKLNEGVHVPGVNGIIWFRPLDENSKILYLQQLGRIIHGINPNKPLKDDERTLVIDIACNRFRVNLDKGSNKQISDIDKLIIIKEWINQNDRIPDLNSFDRVESTYGNTLKKIQEKYIQYVDNLSLLEELKEDKKLEIETVLKLGSDILLWDIVFPEKAKTDKDISNNHDDLVFDDFQISGVLREYYDLVNEVAENDIGRWDYMYEIAKKYYEQYHNLDISQIIKVIIENNQVIILQSDSPKYKDAIPLGEWIRSQRRAYNGTLSYTITPEKKQALDNIGMNWESVYDSNWQKMYEIAKKYYEEYRNLDITNNSRVIIENNKIILVYSKDLRYKNAVQLGRWISYQRNAFNNNEMSFERQELLEKIGMIWKKKEKSNDELWSEMYEIAKMYYERFGNLEVQSYMKVIIENNQVNILQSDNPKYKDAISLGEWIRSQRRAYNGTSSYKMTLERQELLEKIGMNWEGSQDSNWRKMYDVARLYYNQYHNLDVSKKIKVIVENNQVIILQPDNPKYKDAIPLGNWISTQRNAYNGTLSYRITAEKKQALDNIGMKWKNSRDLKWEEMYEIAKKYYKQYGNLIVSQDLVVTVDNEKLVVLLPNNSTYKNGIKLGRWINIQRVAFGNKKILPARKEMLDKIGMVWNTLDEKWQTMYEIAKKYYEQYHNLKIPLTEKFIVENNKIFRVEFDSPQYEDAIPLGKWINIQRVAFHQQKILPARKEMLDKIDMVWSVQQQRKKSTNILDLCKENNIDVEINKSIIEHISYEEFNAKLNYLILNDFGLTDESGMLHEIFFMCSANMEAKYGISLENLIKEYYVSDERIPGV